MSRSFEINAGLVVLDEIVCEAIMPDANEPPPPRIPRYAIVIYWDEQHKKYVSEVPELQACTSEGPSYDDAMKRARSAIHTWVMAAAKAGRPIPEPRGRLKLA